MGDNKTILWRPAEPLSPEHEPAGEKRKAEGVDDRTTPKNEEMTRTDGPVIQAIDRETVRVTVTDGYDLLIHICFVVQLTKLECLGTRASTIPP